MCRQPHHGVVISVTFSDAASLKSGNKVHVKGTRQADGSILAASVTR